MISRKILFSFLLFVGGWLLFVGPAHAQPAANLTMVCLKADKVNDTAEIVKLSGSRLDPLQTIELWRDLGGTYTCAIDKNGASTCGAGAPTAGGNFQVLTATKAQLKPNANQQLVIDQVKSVGGRGASTCHGSAAVGCDWGDEKVLNPSASQLFYAVQQTGVTQLDAKSVALKLAKFAPKVGNITRCTTITWTESKTYWDPYGFVFDSISLEPIRDVQVTLYDANKRPVPNGPGVVNPYTVSKRSAYVFLVPDGIYYLSAAKTGYTFPADAATIARLRVGQQLYTDIYGGDPVVQQNGIIQHRDIPLMPADPTHPTDTKPEIISSLITKYQIGQVVFQLIRGVVTHPFSHITAKSGTHELGRTDADKFGNFEFHLSNDVLNVQDPVELIPEKVSLTGVRLTTKTDFLSTLFGFVKAVSAESNTTVGRSEKIYPLPNFITGTVNGTDGKPVANAIVELLIPNMQNRVLTYATADKNGFISVNYDGTPPTNFEIKVKDSAGKTVNAYSPHAFVESNRNYLKEKKVNLLAVQKTASDYTTTPVPTLGNSGVMPTGVLTTNKQLPTNNKDKRETVNSKQLSNSRNTLSSNPQQFNNNQPSSNSNNYAIVILIVLVIGAGVVGGIYLMKRKKG